MKKQVVGIFASWDLSIWSRPEDVFREKLEENHIHPFTETGPNRFEYEFRSRWFWIFFFAIVIEIIGVSMWYAMGNPSQFISFAVVFFIISIHRLHAHKDTIKIIIDLHKGEYYILKKGELTYRGLLHNIYIRLIGQNSDVIRHRSSIAPSRGSSSTCSGDSVL